MYPSSSIRIVGGAKAKNGNVRIVTFSSRLSTRTYSGIRFEEKFFRDYILLYITLKVCFCHFNFLPLWTSNIYDLGTWAHGIETKHVSTSFSPNLLST